MKWLKLSPERFQTLPDISFSIQKPLFAASALLSYAKVDGAIEASADLRAKIPLKGPIHYSVKAWSLSSDKEIDEADFAFTTVEERDEVGDRVKVMKADELEIENESPVAILAHALVLPAFQETRDAKIDLYGGHILIGSRVEALRLERVSVREEEERTIETYEGKFISVPRALSEADWAALSWDRKKGFELDWNVEGRSIEAARVRLPVFGQLEIRA